ncbi:hypothetical protein FIBSPDRAFT_888845 [Athelia psychrophila]|uniref:ABC transmembrane type-1 domain-containing protein n=1 Tax=Athelia psychrophila TaxID=1759441 RepID=A0A166MW77_9AGAM|nr:hypothetical protein FIBSPDRAFT_888845 [Fibularhizoctonia sp. CBS 109695]
MKPGVPFDVLLNQDSKRKIQSSVGWEKTDRLYGSDAYNIVYPTGRPLPQDSFSSLKYPEPVSYFAKISTAETVPNEDGRTMLKRSDGVEWNVHDLLAMQFGYIKSLAEDLAGEKVLDTILAVPPFFNQFERDHIVDALELGGVRILALINDGTAVVVNYAMTRAFPAPEYHVIYDAGASSVRATVVQFSSEGAGKGKAAGTQITVAGVGYDREIGGTDMDRWHPRRRGQRQGQEGHPRGQARDGEAVEGGRARRSSARHLRRRVFAQPIADALNDAGLTLDNIISVILAGGASRTPLVQTPNRGPRGSRRTYTTVTGMAYPAFGVVYAKGINSFSQLDKLTRQFESDRVILWFFIIAIESTRPRTFSSSTARRTAPAIKPSVVIVIAGSVLGLIFVWKLGLVGIACMPLVISAGYTRLTNKKEHADSAQLACEAAGAIRAVASLTSEYQCVAQYSDSLQGPLKRSNRTALLSNLFYLLSQSISFFVIALCSGTDSRLIANLEFSIFDFFVGLMSTVFGTTQASNVFSFVPDVSSAKHAVSDIFKLLGDPLASKIYLDVELITDLNLQEYRKQIALVSKSRQSMSVGCDGGGR